MRSNNCSAEPFQPIAADAAQKRVALAVQIGVQPGVAERTDGQGGCLTARARSAGPRLAIHHGRVQLVAAAAQGEQAFRAVGLRVSALSISRAVQVERLIGADHQAVGGTRGAHGLAVRPGRRRPRAAWRPRPAARP